MDPKPVSSTRNPITTIRMQCTRNYSLRLQESQRKINVLRLLWIPIHSFGFKRNVDYQLDTETTNSYKKCVTQKDISRRIFDDTSRKKILNLFKMTINNYSVLYNKYMIIFFENTSSQYFYCESKFTEWILFKNILIIDFDVGMKIISVYMYRMKQICVIEYRLWPKNDSENAHGDYNM